MDEWASLCKDTGVERLILSRLEKLGICAHMKHTVQSKIVDTNVHINDLGRTAHSIVYLSDLQVQLKNAIFKELVELQNNGGVPHPVPIPYQHMKEPLDFVREAQEEWESKLWHGVNMLCTEKDVPLSKERTLSEFDQMRRKWGSLGTDFPGLSNLNPIFSPKDFLEVLIRVRSPNFLPGGRGMADEMEVDYGGLMKLNLNIKSLHHLRQFFSCLHPSRQQMETALSKNGGGEYIEKATKVLKNGLCALAKQLCKGGCPIGLRKELWSRALAVETDNQEHAFRFEELKSSLLKYNLLFEKLLVKDVKKTSGNDDNFFVFEDTMLQVLLCFLHDTSLLPHYRYLSITPMTAVVRGDPEDQEPQCQTVYPPNGLIPFYGFSLFVAPICFLFDRPDHLYSMFRELYLRYFVHLHCISSHPQGILGLCCQFEHLLQCKQPELCEHLKKIKAEPLRLSFGWMMSAFSGHLDSREVLKLWDRIIGHDSLLVLPVMAVAVFEFRATNLFKATSYSEAETILSDLRCLNVLPLLQQTLFL